MVTLFLGLIGFLIFCFCMFLYQNSTQKSVNEIHDSCEKELEADFIEASEGDGLMLFDEPLFPEEFDNEH